MAKNATKAKLPPTLIIGLGGTGCDIVSRIDKLSNDNQREFIRFVYFDTDANELRVRQQEAPYIFTVQTSRRLTVGQALRNDSEARNNSFPTNLQLLNKPLTEGAGQVRAVSKLAFDSCLREGRITPLHDAINELQKLNGDSMEQSMRVVIVSTLVGGTGSGILLPVSMYLRNYLENTCQKKPIIRGFCVLPDVFFHGANKTEVEKNNLRANAYATLRELDAFMLKADSAYAKELGGKYWLKMPTPGTVDEYDDYCVNPMDFCFLFDGQNMDGDGLSNLEMYKQHAADCIFASSVSLLNKRLNSSEDNTILQRCAENGRNRYCGVGTSKIVYPFEQVRDYIAMKWMDQAMTEDWLRYDKAYENKMVQQQLSRTRGVMLPPVEKRKFYCDTINSDQGESNYFAFALYEECHNKDKQGISFTTPRWRSYYERLKNFIADRVAEDSGTNGGYDDGLQQDIEEALQRMVQASQSYAVGDYLSAYGQLASYLKSYFSITKRHAEDIAGVIADSVFSPHNFNVSSEHHIEHWLTQNGVPLHPNAIRYFLYNLEILLKEEKRRLNESSENEQSYEANLGAEESDDISFTDLEKRIRTFFEAKNYALETKNDSSVNVNIDTYATSLRKGFFGRDAQAEKMDHIINDCRTQSENIRAYYATYLRLTIIEAALKYLDQLSTNYEYFFQQLENEIKRIPRRIERIEESFVNNAGSPIMYACASQTCLQGLSERCPNIVDSITLTEAFRRELFKGIFETLRINDVEKQKSVIKDLVSNDILEFWRKEVIKQYGRKIDMDIIDALRTQAELEENKYEADEQLYYIEGVRDEALKLAAPFIDRPIGQEPYIIEAYSLGDEISHSDDIQKSSIIRRVFPGYESDPLMDKYQILFMKALYNLKIGDLPKFAPADNNAVDPHGKGDYYKAYWKRIDSIIPDSNKTRILTPHLDKRWHYVGVMPDLSDESEEKCLAEAHKAFLIGILYEWVKFDKDQYRILDKNGDNINENIIVEDGRCNKLIEIYHAMLMSRPLVLSMIERYNDEILKEKSSTAKGSRDYTFMKLHENMRKAHLKAFEHIPVISIFELPILCKASAGDSVYGDEDAISMLKNILVFVEDYLREFYNDPYVRNPYYANWMNEQILLMIENLQNYYVLPDKTILANPLHDSLVKRIGSIVIKKIESFELCPEAVEITKNLNETWKRLTE